MGLKKSLGPTRALDFLLVGNKPNLLFAYRNVYDVAKKIDNLVSRRLRSMC